MTVTKQTYTAAATWTASQVATIFQSAFIDAGLMIDWFDSFLSGAVENRILRVVYNGSKTYGTTFYWFMFSTAGVYVHVASGWDQVGHIPTGTQYLDYFSTTTNSTSNHAQMTVPGSTSTLQLIRYTSGVDLNQSWFLVKGSTQKFVFTVVNGSKALQPWIDLNKGFYTGFHNMSLSGGGSTGRINFNGSPILRREVIRGCGLRGSVTLSHYGIDAWDETMIGYTAINHSNNSNSNHSINSPYVFLPVGFSATNPTYTTDSSPVFYGMPFSPYVVDPLPSDFGLAFHYASNIFATEDTFVVTSGVEEWELLDFASSVSAINGGSPLFLARTI